MRLGCQVRSLKNYDHKRHSNWLAPLYINLLFFNKTLRTAGKQCFLERYATAVSQDDEADEARFYGGACDPCLH